MPMMLVDYPSSESGSDVDVSSSSNVPKNSNLNISLKRKQPLSNEDREDTTHPLQPGPAVSKQALPAPRKRQQSTSTIVNNALPPLPDTFRDLYATTVRTSTVDDPNLHDGRQRGVAHVEGNWPTHVYLEWHPSPTEIDILEKLVNEAAAAAAGSKCKVHSFLRSDLQVPLPLHVSLSAPLVLKTDERNDYLEMIREAIRKHCAAGPLKAQFNRALWSSNRDSTRHFLTLPLSKPQDNSLNRLLHACNLAADHFKLSPLYLEGKPAHSCGTGGAVSWSNPPDLSSCFHVSIAWALEGPRGKEGVVGGGGGKMRGDEGMLKELEKMRVVFDAVKVKIGNVVTAVDLAGGEESGTKRWLGG